VKGCKAEQDRDPRDRLHGQDHEADPVGLEVQARHEQQPERRRDEKRDPDVKPERERSIHGEGLEGPDKGGFRDVVLDPVRRADRDEAGREREEDRPREEELVAGRVQRRIGEPLDVLEHRSGAPEPLEAPRVGNDGQEVGE
jgi:hypothetical protein